MKTGLLIGGGIGLIGLTWLATRKKKPEITVTIPPGGGGTPVQDANPNQYPGAHSQNPVATMPFLPYTTKVVTSFNPLPNQIM